MKQEEIEAMRRLNQDMDNMDNLDGDENYDGEEILYDGFSDDSLDFGGDTGAIRRDFTMTITNNDTSASASKTIALFPGYFTAASQVKDSGGSAVDAIATDGNIISTSGQAVVGTGFPKTIAEFILFCRQFPTRIEKIQISSDNAAQMDESLLIKKHSPFNNPGDKNIMPKAYQNEKNLNDKIVTIPTDDLQLDALTSIIYKIQAGRSVTIKFTATAILNNAAQLDKKVKRMRKTVAVIRNKSARPVKR